MELGTCFVREDSFKGWEEEKSVGRLEAEERFIKKLVDAGGELLDRGQRRKLQLYGERES